MTGPAIQVGAAVRAVRTRHGWSMRELARRAGVSQPFITKLERGDMLPSVATLYDLAHALGVSPSTLLPDVPGAGIEMPDAPGGYTTRLLAGGADRALHVYELLIPPGNGDAEPFQHPGEEVAVVLAGVVLCTQEDTDTEVGAGGSLTLDPGIPHRWRNKGDVTARVLLVCDDLHRDDEH